MIIYLRNWCDIGTAEKCLFSLETGQIKPAALPVGTLVSGQQLIS
jgi:hypothetical protein